MLLFGVLFDVGFTLLRRLMAGERLAQAHRTHLYQLAQRSGVPALRVTLVHWGFALWGGLCCTLFLLVPPVWKPACVVLVLPPQLAWLALVRRLTRRAGMTPPGLRWGRAAGP